VTTKYSKKQQDEKTSANLAENIRFCRMKQVAEESEYPATVQSSMLPEMR